MNEVIPSIIPNDIDKYVTNHYADNKGVHIHYASIGEGPLIVMIHGFPDFWYTWRIIWPSFQLSKVPRKLSYKRFDSTI
jgi:pimeloyl-ACP methyl ester carboxylesterase